MRRVAVGLTIVCVLLLGACGGQSEEEAVQAAVSEFYAAFIDGDGSALCDRLSPEGLDQVFANLDRTAPQTAGADCPTAIESVVPDWPADFRARAREVVVEDVQVSGDKATAQVRAAAAQRPGSSAVELRRIGDRWLLTVPPSAPTAQPPATAPAPTNVTREEAIERADATCAEISQRTDALIDETDLDDPAELEQLDEDSLALERDLAQSLTTLAPPPDERPTFDRFVAAVGLAADLREQSLEAEADGDLQAAEQAARQLAAVIQEGSRAAGEYGMRECARIGQG